MRSHTFNPRSREVEIGVLWQDRERTIRQEAGAGMQSEAVSLRTGLPFGIKLLLLSELGEHFI